MRIIKGIILLTFLAGLQGNIATAHPIEHKFERFSNGEHCQELERAGKKILLCIASVKLTNRSILGFGRPFYCAGKLRISEEGIVTGVSTKKLRGNTRLLRHCLTSLKKFKFYPPIDEEGKNIKLEKVVMSMNYIEKKYAIPQITPYNVYINFGLVKNYKRKPYTGFATLVFAVSSPGTNHK